MRRLLIAAILTVMTVGMAADRAEANQPYPYGFGFQPFGFYQPYGVRYRSRTPTPPYFALNPPVYYGARYSRPYGISPFAAYPTAAAPSGYQGRLRTDFYEGPQGYMNYHKTLNPTANPCIHVSSRADELTSSVAKGPIRTNPFVTDAAAKPEDDQLVAK
ncbi:hypothetical protein V7x_25940 [Crateriforma conspicua]|uniref:Uncharacterized protein n=1 Tax=Crateriforma conspicua TaxID=2527996 RepID=A0A5C6FVA1_9PLAN|nr:MULTISPECIES: hypothetical protein [Crateriforma]TWU67022.1 hypothetical protein V7x_25940 [Crateriforma conspicua]